MSETELLWNITAEDVAKDKLVDPGQYPTEITEMEITPAANKQSMNVRFTFRIFVGPNKGVENWANFFNEKFPQGMSPLFRALGFTPNADGGFSVKINKDTFVGKQFIGTWQRGDYEGKPCNRIVDYMPLKAA